MKTKKTPTKKAAAVAKRKPTQKPVAVPKVAPKPTAEEKAAARRKKEEAAAKRKVTLAAKKLAAIQAAEGAQLKAQEAEILRIAEKYGVEQNFFFITTFKRYSVQIDMLYKLEIILGDESMFVTKEYVKGRQNVYTHPAMKEYNRTTDSANKTVAVLLKIINSMRKHPIADDEDPLLKLLAGRDDYDAEPGVDDDESED